MTTQIIQKTRIAKASSLFYYLASSPKSAGESFVPPRWLIQKKRGTVCHAVIGGPEKTLAQGVNKQPTHNAKAIMLSLVLIEKFSGFQLQDKHNASIFMSW